MPSKSKSKSKSTGSNTAASASASAVDDGVTWKPRPMGTVEELDDDEQPLNPSSSSSNTTAAKTTSTTPPAPRALTTFQDILLLFFALLLSGFILMPLLYTYAVPEKYHVPPEDAGYAKLPWLSTSWGMLMALGIGNLIRGGVKMGMGWGTRRGV